MAKDSAKKFPVLSNYFSLKTGKVSQNFFYLIDFQLSIFTN